MPFALSCWTGSHETWISKAVIAVALMFDGPTVGSVRRKSEVKRSEYATYNSHFLGIQWYKLTGMFILLSVNSYMSRLW